MIKIPENKTRKRLRITLCIIYLFQMVLCAWPFYDFTALNGGVKYTKSVFEMIGSIGLSNEFGIADSVFSSVTTVLLANIIFVILPVVGFFFCALDKEKNLKNIVSLICCLVGVVAILTVVTINLISLGSVLALLLYLLASFLTTISMMARLTDKNPDPGPTKEEKFNMKNSNQK